MWNFALGISYIFPLKIIITPTKTSFWDHVVVLFHALYEPVRFGLYKQHFRCSPKFYKGNPYCKMRHSLRQFVQNQVELFAIEYLRLHPPNIGQIWQIICRIWTNWMYKKSKEIPLEMKNGFLFLLQNCSKL